jgi:molecular chaperone DnaK (HSP70)
MEQAHEELIIGIDFGTEYTYVAFVYSPLGVHSQQELAAMVWNIALIRDWPKAPGGTAKTPSCIAYKHGKVLAWGWKAQPELEAEAEIYKYFKPRLHHDFDSDFDRYDFDRWPESATSRLRQRSRGECKNPEVIVADYLESVLTYVRTQSLPKRFGFRFLEKLTVSYVLTVPTIWNDRTKFSTRKAAVRAGIPEESLVLVTESEAAALFCATTCRDLNVNDGDCFLVCDAGSTVVYLSY